MNTQPDDMSEQSRTPQPVAYDANGQPLYAHPPVAASSEKPAALAGPTVVHIARSLEQEPVEVPQEIKDRNERSKKAYPQLDLSDTEFVVLSVHRHIIGLLGPLILTLIVLCLIVAGLFLLPELVATIELAGLNLGLIYLIGIAICLLLAGGMYTLYWVYYNNTFFLTNENIIEKTQLSLFSSNVKSVSLGDVVDVSYRQTGLVEQLFNFGTVQVGTKDDDVPYVFHTVRSPREQTAVLKDAVANYKNGRSIETSEEHIAEEQSAN